MRRAMMSFPVPLSPVIRTGTLAAATLPSCERTACMASEWPKIMLSGGTSPSDCAREVTESVVIANTPLRWCHPHALKVHLEHQIGEASKMSGTTLVKCPTYQSLTAIVSRERSDKGWHQRATRRGPRG